MLPRDAEADPPADAASASPLPFVEIPPEARRADLPPLDPDATPLTELGELRARDLPLWTQDFDLAFPPPVCGTAWELDGIAVPVTGVNISHYGDPATMAALAVMRYEHLLATAFANPTRLAQLCVAVAAVGPAREDALSELAPVVSAAEDTTAELTARLRDVLLAATEGTPEAADAAQVFSAPTGRDSTGLNALPHVVTLVGVSPSSVLAVACIDPQHAASANQDSPGSPSSTPKASLLRAYELDVVRGIEDSVLDVSYRVSLVEGDNEGDCSDLPEWTATWQGSVLARANEGQLWLQANRTVSTDDLCSTPPTPNDANCPAAWTEPGNAPP